MVGAGPDLISNEYTDVNDAALAATTSLSALWLRRPAAPTGADALIVQVGDISAIYADFLGAGSKQDWMVGLESVDNVAHAMMFRTDVDPTYYVITVTGWALNGGYGASWTFRGSAGDRIFFAANNGDGVFELDVSTVSLSRTGFTGTGSFTVNKLGLRSGPFPGAVQQSDGISCPTAYVPFMT